MKVFGVALAVLLVAACATPEEPQRPRSPAEKRMGDAVVAPLADLNLIRTPIPPVLAEAKKAPYAVPPDLSCPAVAAQIESLDAVLGADLDVPASAGEPSLLERGADAAGEAVVGAVRSTTEGVIPFRSWVRRLTGADRHAREVAAAITAGGIRRAYLKGLGQARGCGAPAAPGMEDPGLAGPPRAEGRARR